MGSDYIATKRPESAASYGKVLYTYEEFANLSRDSKPQLVVFVDDADFDALAIMSGSPTTLLQVDGISVVTNQKDAKLVYFSRLMR